MLNNQLSVKFERGWSYGSWKKVTMRDKKQIQEENKLTTKLVKDQSSQFLNKFLWKCWLVKINKWSKKFFFLSGSAAGTAQIWIEVSHLTALIHEPFSSYNIIRMLDVIRITQLTRNLVFYRRTNVIRHTVVFQSALPSTRTTQSQG